MQKKRYHNWDVNSESYEDEPELYQCILCDTIFKELDAMIDFDGKTRKKKLRHSELEINANEGGLTFKN